jgi:putative ABC transport system substrate-binding protein
MVERSGPERPAAHHDRSPHCGNIPLSLIGRRSFIASLALGALSGPGVVRGQPGRKLYRIGILGTSTHTAAELAGPQPKSPFIGALLRGLRELGYVYGEHFVTETRSAEGKVERFPNLAAELVGLKVDVIVGPGPALPALKQATSTIPVVMVGAAAPVSQGLVQSLARPGGNFTGLSLQLTETTGKRLELLKELAPGPAPVAILWDRLGAAGGTPWEAAQSAARQRGWALVSLDIRESAGKIEVALKAASDAGAGGLLVHPVALLDQNAARIAELAIRRRLPAIYGLRLYVEAGGLMSYSADLIDMFQRAAVFVDKILKGTTPADLPVEQPTKFDLVVNLKAAKAIGLTIPPSLLARATDVLQ